MKKELPIRPEEITSPVHPILSNYLAWRILVEAKRPSADKFGDELLAYLEDSRKQGGGNQG